MILSLGSMSNVRAEEIKFQEQLLIEKNGDLEKALNVGSIDMHSINLMNNMIINSSDTILDTQDGDRYENNNGPEKATIDRYNEITYASLHNSDDVDWYKIEVDNASKPISVFLTNIPNGCDYDMYLVQYDSASGITNMNYNIKAGTTPEELYGTVNEAGTYYVVIQAKPGLENNYSSSNYTLYMGDYFRTGQHGYVETDLSINFGYVPVGNTEPVYKGR